MVIITILLLVLYVISLYFCVFLLLVYLDDKEMKQRKAQYSHYAAKLPTVSIIVPAYNESKTILGTLESIHNLRYPKHKIEVVVVNDGSIDDTKEKVQRYIHDKPNFHLLSHTNRGKAASLNRALQSIQGEFFACLDADSFVDPSTLQRMLSLYYSENDARIAIITPTMKVANPATLLQKVQWLEYIVITLISRISSRLDSLYVAPGPFSLYRTSIIQELGGFDEHNLTEDQEIAYRVQQHHYRIRQCADGYVYTTAPAKIGSFYRQRRRWYLGSIICLHKYKHLFGSKRYGDFGTMQMIKNVFCYLGAAAAMILSIRLIIIPFVQYLQRLFIVGFDILPFLRNLKLKLTLFHFLIYDIRAGVLILSLSAIGVYFFLRAHREVEEKTTKLGLIPLIPYFAYYYTLKGVILMLCVLEFVRGKKSKW